MSDERNNQEMHDGQNYGAQPGQNINTGYDPNNQTNGNNQRGQASYGGTYGQYSYNPYGRNGGYNRGEPQQEYHWSFEDYEASGRRPDRGPKKRTGAAVVIGALLAAVFLVGVICLAGYGIYSLWATDEGDLPYSASESAPAESAPETVSHTLTIKDHAQSEQEVSADGKLTTVEIAKKVRPSVVGIAQYSARDTFSPSGQGSGIIMNDEGYIVTNAHVVQNSAGISVELDNGENYSAKLIGIDSKTDLAVIKIDAQGLTPAEFGSSDSLEVGERVIAIGNPGGSILAGSVTQGIVSAVNRVIKDDGYASKYIQTDAAINPGNSGGALVNEYGQVIGINSSKIASVAYEGIGFAIPISEAKPIIDDLMTNGYVTGRTKIGITGTEINEALSQINGIPTGIYITYVDPSSDLAGKNIARGDIMIAIDDTKVETFSDVSAILKTKSPGEVVRIKFYRSARGMADTGKTFTLDVALMEDVEKN